MASGRMAAEAMFDANSMEDFAVVDVFKVGPRDINCVESAAPSRASSAQVCPE
ncbi:hypothetical protein X729_24970 [Mesorhizobium sp. L103C131B0]|nr:hypothetical protein X729_24970 [Mesorhizobium sp. L103C131B0]